MGAQNSFKMNLMLLSVDVVTLRLSDLVLFSTWLLLYASYQICMKVEHKG